jgi:hypothetical protein
MNSEEMHLKLLSRHSPGKTEAKPFETSVTIFEHNLTSEHEARVLPPH